MSTNAHRLAKLSDNDLQRLSDLAQLSLPQSESAKKLKEQLSEIISYVSKVQECAETMVISPSDWQAVKLRPDSPSHDAMGNLGKDNLPQWLQQSPSREGGMVSVPGLFTENGDGTK